VAEDKAPKDKADEAEDAAAETGAAEGLEEGKKKRRPKKLVLIAGVVAVMLLAGLGGVAFYFLHARKAGDAAHAAEQSAGDADAKSAKAVFYNLGDLLVNLSGEGKHPNFLKVKISLELADEKDVPLIDAIKPRVVDNFQVYLRELRIEDLRGSAGMYRLREELLMRVTEAAQPVRIRDVLFQEMLVQ